MGSCHERPVHCRFRNAGLFLDRRRAGGDVVRREFSPKVKVAAFKRADGQCENCTAKLYVGKFHYDHDIPDSLGGEPTLENCKVLCVACHGVKTARIDVPKAAKVKRITQKHIGARPKRPWPKRRMA